MSIEKLVEQINKMKIDQKQIDVDDLTKQFDKIVLKKRKHNSFQQTNSLKIPRLNSKYLSSAIPNKTKPKPPQKSTVKYMRRLRIGAIPRKTLPKAEQNSLVQSMGSIRIGAIQNTATPKAAQNRPVQSMNSMRTVVQSETATPKAAQNSPVQSMNSMRNVVQSETATPKAAQNSPVQSMNSMRNVVQPNTNSLVQSMGSMRIGAIPRKTITQAEQNILVQATKAAQNSPVQSTNSMRNVVQSKTATPKAAQNSPVQSTNSMRNVVQQNTNSLIQSMGSMRIGAIPGKTITQAEQNNHVPSMTNSNNRIANKKQENNEKNTTTLLEHLTKGYPRAHRLSRTKFFRTSELKNPNYFLLFFSNEYIMVQQHEIWKNFTIPIISLNILQGTNSIFKIDLENNNIKYIQGRLPDILNLQNMSLKVQCTYNNISIWTLHTMSNVMKALSFIYFLIEHLDKLRRIEKSYIMASFINWNPPKEKNTQ